MTEKLYLLTYKGTLEGESGESLGTKYSLKNACNTCGTGANILGSLYVKKLKANKAITVTLDRDFLIVNELYHNLKLMNAQIGELQQVVDSKLKERLPYYHFKANVSFPKVRPDSEGIITEDQCPTCKQDGFFDDHVIGAPRIVRKYKYNLEEVKGILPKSDVFHTWEHFGKSNLVPEGLKVVRYTRPRIIVKENIKNIFEDVKVKHLIFEEVFFI